MVGADVVTLTKAKPSFDRETGPSIGFCSTTVHDLPTHSGTDSGGSPAGALPTTRTVLNPSAASKASSASNPSSPSPA